ncbi:CAZyme family AA11 [Penicillium maclennaniae]|uniref:CAZyme family AA11 n=1 Tax=Penicillium maclennaniae TaxID=1343394 RepID=UPI0025415653|nr:CAZyme family AA11 [Penicillium maclennaniae]KAJ5665195.1 CAZyme family AA11 [Penicillium maclennaniae]
MFAKSMLMAVLGASVVNAHMIMSNPVPYGKSTLNNSPLAADGSDFPCKLRDGTYDVTTENTIAIGESHALTFEGSATHGGGSCQISMTTDRAPTKDTEWKVIKSFEGGCPANVDGNLSGGASLADPYQFNFTIPEGIETGKYTLAWTWFNRIGNREMYMNCAPVTVTSGSSKRSVSERTPTVEKRSANFPPMFVANVNGCTTKEGVDIRFPQPGDVVEYDGEPANLAAEGSAACTGTATFGASGDTASGSSDSSSSGSSSGSSSSGSESSAAASSAPTETSSAAVAPTTSSVPAETSAPTVPETASTSTEAAPEATSSSSNTISSGNSSTKSGTCSTEGQWNCIAGTSFQRCANGQWSVAQQMASGTVCTAGLSSDLTISASKMARHVSEMRFRKRNLHGHHA